MLFAVPALLRWDLSVPYPGLDSPEFVAALASFSQDLADLAALLVEPPGALLDAAAVAACEQIISRYNAALDQSTTLANYILCFTSTDSRNALAQARASELQRALVELDQIGARFSSWVGALDLAALEARSALARAHSYPLRRAQQRSRHLMPPAEEALASELGASGGRAWRRLYSTVSSQLSVDFERDGRAQPLPLSVIFNYAYSADRDTRRRAYLAELRALQGAAAPLAAALNGVKGEVNVLSRRRGWDSALDESLFISSIDRETLDVMLTATREALPDMRRYLRIKARALGVAQLAWYDLFAPLGASASAWEYQVAAEFIVRQFSGYSERLGALAAQAFREGWVDAEPRPGKRGGGFCERLRPGESRILINYTPSFANMSILAHELGHAYHTLCQADRTALQSRQPETLAETASIFCETLVRQAALQHAGAPEQIAILNQSLQSSAQRVLSMSSRFLAEQRIFELRQRRELAIDEICAILQQSQREIYGDGLDPNELHPYIWAAKPHYFDPALSFYNYPYVFGLLFALGLYAQFQRDPEAFRPRYDALLSSTGMADAATLAAQCGFDIRAPEFWRSSLALISAEIDRFEQLIGAGAA